MTTAPIRNAADRVIQLYETYRDSVRVMCEEQRALLAGGMRARLDDREAELT
jgi:hypothetical protein